MPFVCLSQLGSNIIIATSGYHSTVYNRNIHTTIIITILYYILCIMYGVCVGKTKTNDSSTSVEEIDVPTRSSPSILSCINTMLTSFEMLLLSVDLFQ